MSNESRSRPDLSSLSDAQLAQLERLTEKAGNPSDLSRLSADERTQLERLCDEAGK